MLRRWWSPRRLRRLLVAGVALAAAFLLVPFALNEGPGTETPNDLSGPSRGQVASLTSEVQRLGFACSDQDPSAATLSRLCTMSEPEQYGRLVLSATAATGQLARVAFDVWHADANRAVGANVAGAIASALALSAADGDRLADALGRVGAAQQGQLRWGSFTATTEGHTQQLDLRSAAGQRPAPPVQTAIGSSVDRLRQVAEAQGYSCETPEVTSIRACSRTSGGYSYELWAQGKGDTIRRLDLSVTATHRRHTRERYATELGTLLRALATPQTDDLAGWVGQTGRARGADAFVGGMNIRFTTTGSTYTKETSAYLTGAPCGSLAPVGAPDPCLVEG